MMTSSCCCDDSAGPCMGGQRCSAGCHVTQRTTCGRKSWRITLNAVLILGGRPIHVIMPYGCAGIGQISYLPLVQPRSVQKKPALDQFQSDMCGPPAKTCTCQWANKDTQECTPQLPGRVELIRSSYPCVINNLVPLPQHMSKQQMLRQYIAHLTAAATHLAY